MRTFSFFFLLVTTLGCSHYSRTEAPTIWTVCTLTESSPGPDGEIVEVQAHVVGDTHGLYLLDRDCSRGVYMTIPEEFEDHPSHQELLEYLDPLDAPVDPAEMTVVQARVIGRFHWAPGGDPMWSLTVTAPTEILEVSVGWDLFSDRYD